MTEPDVKFNRTYTLKVELAARPPGSPAPGEAGFAVIKLPFSISFEVTRNLGASANACHLRIYNLDPDSRDRVYRDRYIFDYRAVQLWAGYQGRESLIFNGNILQAWSFKDSGSEDVITEIEAQESYAMVNAFSNHTQGQQGYRDILNLLAKDMPNLGAPQIGNVPGTTGRGVTLYGNTWRLMQKYTGGSAMTIDNNRLLVLQPNECLTGSLPTIDATVGLLGSPYRSDNIIEFEMMFTPQLEVGQQVLLNSSINRIFNKPYKVVGFQHSGMISPSVEGPARTLVQLLAGTSAFVPI